MLGRDNGLKGALRAPASRLLALDPAAPAQLSATMPCRKACVRRQSDISIGEKL
jgi:hypothetical protein